MQKRVRLAAGVGPDLSKLDEMDNLAARVAEKLLVQQNRSEGKNFRLTGRGCRAYHDLKELAKELLREQTSQRNSMERQPTDIAECGRARRQLQAETCS